VVSCPCPLPSPCSMSNHASLTPSSTSRAPHTPRVHRLLRAGKPTFTKSSHRSSLFRAPVLPHSVVVDVARREPDFAPIQAGGNPTTCDNNNHHLGHGPTGGRGGFACCQRGNLRVSAATVRATRGQVLLAPMPQPTVTVTATATHAPGRAHVARVAPPMGCTPVQRTKQDPDTRSSRHRQA